MREILFRAKGKGSGNWLYGYYARLSDVTGMNDVLYAPARDPDDSNHTYCIHPETIGEYTGLRDKNGERIFEGDVIKDGKHLYLIEWYASDLDAGFSPFICNENCRAVCSCNCEIVGNIHDNPELLEGE